MRGHKNTQIKIDKADSITVIANSLRAEAAVYEDLNQVLIIAINYQPSDDDRRHDRHHDDDED